MEYSNQFMTNETIKDASPESQRKRIAADYFRKQLTRGYRPDELFYQLCYRLSDDQILENHAQHAQEKAEHGALMNDYKARQTKTPKPLTQIERVTAAAMAKA